MNKEKRIKIGDYGVILDGKEVAGVTDYKISPRRTGERKCRVQA